MIQLTVGDNSITYPGEVTTRQVDLITSKCMWNSVIRTPVARYMGKDAENFHLVTPMDR